MGRKRGKQQPEVTRTEVPEIIPSELPVLPTRDAVAFPGVVMALYVGSSTKVASVERALEAGRLIYVVAQRNDVQEPWAKDLYSVGVIAQVVRMLKLSDDRHKVLVQGITRARAMKFRREDCLYAEIDPIVLSSQETLSRKDKVVIKRIKQHLQVLVEREHLPEEILLVAEDIADPGQMADVILAHYRLEVSKAQTGLEELDPSARIRLVDKIINDDLNQFIISESIRARTQDELSKGQRDYYLREQIKQIQVELGESDDNIREIKELRAALEKASLPQLTREEVVKQINRLEGMPAESGEYSLLRTYIDWILELPWEVRTEDQLDLKATKEVLDEDHYGLEKAKDRIIEYLSVRKLNAQVKGPILCFVGPPGVGKTSLGYSIARALGRKFHRMSLGGVRDEAEIRGHRRTYVGALPGRVIQGLKQAGSKNCVLVLDELDKIGTDFRGDPSAALLEVLDPHQNKEFRDHYLTIPFDLSEVLFVATANTVDTIPDALLDRLEIIYLSGYTTQEKEKIARQFIIPRQLKENGLQGKRIRFHDDAIVYVIERYTAEAGVRNLEREIGALCRKIARQYAETKKITREITVEGVTKLLGPTKFDPEPREGQSIVGLARGLAWTVNGGEIMPVEASVAPGSGALTLTGQLGSVMQESAQAALFYARANAQALGLDPHFSEKFDIHIHVPAGATPKDGPSAGVTIACALVSALSFRKVSSKFAMTGEMTLRGNVLPVGGLKEKALAALRYGCEKVIIPQENVKDIDEIPLQEREKIEFVPVTHVEEVFKLALLEAEGPNPLSELVTRKGKKKK